MHTAFITGCATGFGQRLAATLLAAGHRVIATDPDPGAVIAALGSSDRMLVLALDVRDAAQVREAAAAAAAWGNVDVLVNNAGYAIFSTIEEADLDAIRDLFEVNVIGLARVTQALLPQIRANAGLVVQLSSVAGRTVFPESGYYAATKYAVEALSEALSQECASFGVRVVLIEPGSFATQFSARATAASPHRRADSPYAAARPRWDANKSAVLCPPQDPMLVVQAIIEALGANAPIHRRPVGPDALQALTLRDTLGPDGWSRLAYDRAGGRAPRGEGEVLSPAEVLAIAAQSGADAARVDARSAPAQLAPTRHALRLGYLSHWADEPGGAEALAWLQSTD